MKKNRILTAALAGALSLSLAVPAFGARWEVTPTPSEGNDTTPDVTEKERTDNGHTTISVITSASAAGKNVSFEVPMYLTFAAINGQTQLMAPSLGAYYIKNTGAPGSGNIAVTGLKLQKLAGSTYNIANPFTNPELFTQVNPSDKSTWTPKSEAEMSLVLGNCYMPSTSSWGASEEKEVDLKADATLRNIGNSFYQKDGSFHNSNILAPNAQLNLTTHGRVASATRGEVGATAQFRVTYTISPLNDLNQPITGGAAFSYAGDSSVAAGLGDLGAQGAQDSIV